MRSSLRGAITGYTLPYRYDSIPVDPAPLHHFVVPLPSKGRLFAATAL